VMRSTRQLHELRIGVPAMASRVQLYLVQLWYVQYHTVTHCGTVYYGDILLDSPANTVHINAIEEKMPMRRGISYPAS
jgi:hypothetical protein